MVELKLLDSKWNFSDPELSSYPSTSPCGLQLLEAADRNNETMSSWLNLSVSLLGLEVESAALNNAASTEWRPEIILCLFVFGNEKLANVCLRETRRRWQSDVKRKKTMLKYQQVNAQIDVSPSFSVCVVSSVPDAWLSILQLSEVLLPYFLYQHIRIKKQGNHRNSTKFVMTSRLDYILISLTEM